MTMFYCFVPSIVNVLTESDNNKVSRCRQKRNRKNQRNLCIYRVRSIMALLSQVESLLIGQTKEFCQQMHDFLKLLVQNRRD